MQNVVAADVLGFTTILVKDSTEVVNLLVYYLRTEEERLVTAWDFLRRNKGQPSLTSDGVRRHVLYDHFLVAELLHDPSFLPLHAAPETGRFNFYPPEERQNFPDDLDTTALALSVLHTFGKVDIAVIDTVLDTMLEYVTEEGLILVYFDPLRRRTDHVVQVIICYLFHLAGRVEPTRKVREFLFKMLKRRANLRGSLYNSNPEVFLWHLARLKPALEPKMVKLLAKRVRERVGYPGDALDLAMRVMACDHCGISSSRDRKQLARMQKADGLWEL